MSNYQHERGWLDSEVWGNIPYDERSAWSWMIAEAHFEDGEQRIGKAKILLLRGQFSSSLRFMAEKFRWSKSKVSNYIAMLEQWGMITSTQETVSGTGQNVITICNYNRYQAKRGKAGTTQGQDEDNTRTTQGQTINPSSHSNPSNHIHTSAEQFRKIYDEGSSVFPALATRNTGSITKWLEAGADPDLDVLPEIRRAASSGKTIKSWNYFDGAVVDAVSSRLRPLPHGTPKPEKKSFHRQNQEAAAKGIDMARNGDGQCPI